ncbi:MULTISPECIES: 50S ribosomal protein L25/general stress protein Ctc [Paracoccus]|jgi:large subunit ribosomal protein L25|uniref:Large ribosomal subunit protein bL25 n=2 Tax=Paracoccus TaxID=265 RepID=A0A5C4R3B5_9RHOB|nr:MULTISPECIES: 50S ribosomal protein L25/general stress protein Ctc [Paracoccus]TYP66980.1 LSU ribosomal protein L25P [Stutzerimonas stutzeri]AZY93439.1 50S ribosomal protein L25/general stress protein Ctc [Paracoccus sp. Arc7-R13]KIX18502.1 50S ribosomal protein L25 [Paracoccus sp. 228]KJZ31778.1 50S ribosomal protein L25 [Paracoccus sp. S4493]MBF5077817.1 50S ribosomal protein L25/general stress protein Ctc [Paracoccus sp. NBH48]|tara:strand:+ start:123 stop:752 length:630 start_codon:yes stop_codon:yes gene_type:complete
MAKEIPNLVAEARAGSGKGAARQTRREGKVPGIVYGDGKEPVSIAFDFNKLLTTLRAGRFMSTLWNLQVEGQDDVRVICRGVQRDVVKDLPIHIDFMRLRRTSKVNLFIPVEFINEDKCPGLKRGGTLVTVRPEVELVVTAGDIPDHLTVDLEGRQIGDTIHISDVTLPNGAKATIDRDFVIANLAAPSALRAEDDAEDGDAAEAAAEA